jgi:hypothetical protein
MKRFVFPLERALEIRRMQAEAERAKLEALVGEQARREAEKIERLAERDGCWVVPPAGAAADPSALGTASRYRRHLTGIVQGIEWDLRRLGAEVGQQRLAAMEAQRRQELLEKLRERRRREWEAASVRELDEIAADSHRARLHSHARVQKREVLGGVLRQAGE